MFHLRRISFLQRSLPRTLISCRSRSTRHTSKSVSIDEKHIRTESQRVSLDSLSPVLRQILSKDPSYALRFGGQLSENKHHLVRQQSRTTGRAEQLFSQIPKDEIIPPTNEDNDDLPHPPIVAFPSEENRFQIDLGTEDKTVVGSHGKATCFGCGASLQCADRNQP